MSKRKYVITLESDLPDEVMDSYADNLEKFAQQVLVTPLPDNAQSTVSYLAAKVRVAESTQELSNWLYTLSIVTANLSYGVQHETTEQQGMGKSTGIEPKAVQEISGERADDKDSGQETT